MATTASRLRPWVQEKSHTNLKPSSSQDVTVPICSSFPSQRSTLRRSNYDVDLNEITQSKGESICNKSIFSEKIIKSDLEEVMDRVNKRTAQEIGAPKVPDVHWEDVGGLEDVKKIIMETVELPLRHKYVVWMIFARYLQTFIQ